MHIEKHLDDLTIEEVMGLHVDSGSTSSTKDFLVESTLRVIHAETRHCLQNNHSNKYMPCLGVMAMLDQIGNCYYRGEMATYPHSDASGIKKALYYFGGFGPNDASSKALYAFRNAICHNSALHNEYRGNFFRFRYEPTIPGAVQPPATPWDGNLSSSSESNITLINVKNLVDLASNIVHTLGVCLHNNVLLSDLTKDQIIQNYLLWVPRQTT
jgi:hypothetical protein